MNKLLILISFITIYFYAIGQEAELKKKIFYVNGKVELSLESCKAPKADGQTCMVKSAKTGEPLFTTYVYDAYSIKIDIKFIDFNEELRTEGMVFKKLFILMYDMKVINEDGSVNEENARRFARAYDIIKDRKVIISK